MINTTKYIVHLKQSKKLRREKNKKIVTFCRLQLNNIQRTLRLQDLEKEEKKNIFIDAVGPNEEMVVDEKITIEDWYVDNEFNNEKVKISDDIKLYIDNLIRKTIENKKVPNETFEKVTDPIKQADEKQPPPPYETAVTLDDILKALRQSTISHINY